MTDRDKLSALAIEARRRGLSYGQLMAATTAPQRETIYKRYERARAVRESRREAEQREKAKNRKKSNSPAGA